MTEATSTEPLVGGTDGTIELSLAAEAAQLSVTRALAATVAAQEDFDVDSIADIRLAIDEACSRLIVRATPGSRMTCRFAPTATGLTVTVSTTTDEGEPLDSKGFGWHVLTALTDSVSSGQNADGAGSFVTTIEFTKRKHGWES